MANTMVFSSAYIRTVQMALDESTKKVRINFTSSLTKEVREKMEWYEPERTAEGRRTIEEAAMVLDLDGELQAGSMSLTPSNKELRGAAFSLDIASLSHFQLVTVESGEGVRMRELRFQALTTVPGALAAVEAYTDHVGQGKGSLKVSYVKQEELPLADVRATAGQQEELAEL